ncbi:MAG TPA: 2'-5' RNA ligase family protein [Polyangiaceae bacterium]|nr:2'-5' RNA ligase family protein [Polyangiaceae bacterium]
MSRDNWFFAFPIDGTFVLELPALPANFRRFHPEDVHLTLAFLGRCGQAAAERALTALDHGLARHPQAALAVSLADVVPMGGSRRSYSALSALLARGRAETSACIARLRDSLTQAASDRTDARPPKPHVSLARPRSRASDADREAGLTWAAALSLQHIHVCLDRIALYTWSETRQERLFQIVAERRLLQSCPTSD